MNLNTEEMLEDAPVLEKGFEIIDGKAVERDRPLLEESAMNPEEEDRLFEEAVRENGLEWVDGRVVEKPMGAESALVGCNLIGELKSFLRDQKLGLVFLSEVAYQIFATAPKKFRKPDVTFVASGRLPQDRPPRGNMTIPPDLAVEVISPNDVAEDIEVRIAELLGASVRLLWIVYPATRSVWVVRHDGTAARLTETQSLSGENVIPGFSCPLDTLFAGI